MSLVQSVYLWKSRSGQMFMILRSSISRAEITHNYVWHARDEVMVREFGTVSGRTAEVKID